MTKGAVIYEKGSPDVFKWENIDVPDPKFDEVLIKNTAVGCLLYTSDAADE